MTYAPMTFTVTKYPPNSRWDARLVAYGHHGELSLDVSAKGHGVNMEIEAFEKRGFVRTGKYD